MTSISTHVLDVSAGRPASGIPVTLRLLAKGEQSREVGRGTTDEDGRVSGLGPDPLVAGHYRLEFGLADYRLAGGATCFFPEITVDFTISAVDRKYHVPVLLSPYSYSTYLGS